MSAYGLHCVLYPIGPWPEASQTTVYGCVDSMATQECRFSNKNNTSLQMQSALNIYQRQCARTDLINGHYNGIGIGARGQGTLKNLTPFVLEPFKG